MPLAGTCTTGWPLLIEIVDIGLAVRDDDDLRGMQIVAHHLPQRLRRPVLAKVDLQSLLLLGFRQHLAHLRQYRQRRARRFGIVEKSLAANVADQHLDPAAQLQPGHQHEQERQQQHRDADEHQHEIPRRSLPAVDETQVMQHQHAKRHRLARRRNRSATPAPSRTATARRAPPRASRRSPRRRKSRLACARS